MATQVDSISNRRINLYEVLQVSPKAGPEVIQAAYRALARNYHPDVNAAPDAARQMRQLNAAYGVLSDPERRARYDAMRQRPARARRPGEDVVINIDDAPAATESATTGSAGAGPTRARPSYIRAVPIAATPPPATPRLGRLLGLLMFMVLVIASAVYGLWLIAGALDDEPMRAMPPVPEIAQTVDAPASASLFSVPADILSSVLSHNDGPQPMGR